MTLPINCIYTCVLYTQWSYQGTKSRIRVCEYRSEIVTECRELSTVTFQTIRLTIAQNIWIIQKHIQSVIPFVVFISCIHTFSWDKSSLTLLLYLTFFYELKKKSNNFFFIYKFLLSANQPVTIVSQCSV